MILRNSLLKLKSYIIPAVVISTAGMLASCGQEDVNTVSIWKNLNRTDSTGLESIATRIDTVTFRTDSLYDIGIIGVSDDRFFGLTADDIIVVLSHDGRVLDSHDIHGRGPGEFTNLTSIIYDQYNDEILIYDTWNKIIRLDADGNFKDEVKNGETALVGDIAPLGKSLYAATGISNSEREFSITVLDRNFNPVHRMMPLMNDAQRSKRGIIAFEGIDVFNSKVLYKPFGEYTYYEITDSSFTPYLRVDCGKHEMPAEMHVAVTGNKPIKKYFQIQYEAICGRYYLVQFLYVDNNLWYHDVYDTETGERMLHTTYTEEEFDNGVDAGFIFRSGGHEYRIIPQFEKDNVLYWSRFNDDGSTTLFRIQL